MKPKDKESKTSGIKNPILIRPDRDVPVKIPKYKSFRFSTSIVFHSHMDLGWLKTIDQYYQSIYLF